MLNAIEAHGIEIDLDALRGPTPTGIYFLILDSVIVYVGQSANVPQRIAMHLALADKRFDRARWIQIAAGDLDAYEGALIRRLAPIGNFSAPRDLGRDGEILARFGLVPCDESRRTFERRRLSTYSPHKFNPRHSRADDARVQRRARARRRLRAGLWVALETAGAL